MTHTLKKLLLAAVLAVPFAASADHDDDDDERRVRHAAHVHVEACRHEHRIDVPPRPPPRHEGRYELRLVSQWIEGRYEQVWVPERCKQKRNGKLKCVRGYYDHRYVPGHYAQVEQWVWVPAPVRRYDVPPRPVHAHAHLGVTFGS